jgi:hypothetical protein
VKRFRRAAPAEVATHFPDPPPNVEEPEAPAVDQAAEAADQDIGAEAAGQHIDPEPGEPDGTAEVVDLSYGLGEPGAVEWAETDSDVEPGRPSDPAVAGHIVLEEIDLGSATDAALEAAELSMAAEAALEAVDLTRPASMQPRRARRMTPATSFSSQSS